MVLLVCQALCVVAASGFEMHGAVGGRGPVGLIERDRELAALDGLLDAHRAATVTIRGG